MLSKKWFTALAMALGLIATAASSSRAGTVLATAFPGPRGYGGFQIISDPNASWTQAEADARRRGGYLATFETGDQQTFVTNLMAKIKAPSGGYWFGLHEIGTSHKYGWLTNKPLTYTNWLPGQPDNNGGHEVAASMLWSQPGQNTYARHGKWNDLPDFYPNVKGNYPDLVKAGYIVEYLNKANFIKGGGSFASAASFKPAIAGGSAPSAIPLPAAAARYPLGVAVAGFAARRLRREQLA